MSKENMLRAALATKQLEIDKLKKKCNDVLSLRKEVDRLNEELQLCELRYNHLKDKIDEYTQDPLNKGRIDDSSR